MPRAIVAAPEKTPQKHPGHTIAVGLQDLDVTPTHSGNHRDVRQTRARDTPRRSLDSVTEGSTIEVLKEKIADPPLKHPRRCSWNAPGRCARDTAPSHGDRDNKKKRSESIPDIRHAADRS